MASKVALLSPEHKDTMAAIVRGLEKRKARGNSCPHCMKKLRSHAELSDHLITGYCFNIEPKAKGTIDPQRPELGRVPKHSLLWSILNRDAP